MTEFVMFGMKILFFFVLTFSPSLAAGWSYSGDDGPDYWSDRHPTCASTHQSPIAIWLKDLRIRAYGDKSMGLQFQNYDESIRNATIINNGHTVVIRLPPENHLTFTGGHLQDVYKLLQFHFHWGHDDNAGSEHTIGHSQYPLELHLVHMNEKMNRPEAVLGIFFQLSENSSESNPQMEGIVKQLQLIKLGQTIGYVNDFIRISDLLPRNLDDYIYYNGSLTTPPCMENIHWTILKEIQFITKDQLDEFRALRSNTEDEPLGDNFRPTQPLNDRTVTFYTYQPASTATRRAFGVSLSFLAVAVSFSVRKIRF